LILETERDADGKFPVRQAVPGKITRRGVKGKVVGWRKFLGRQCENGKGRPKDKGGSAESQHDNRSVMSVPSAPQLCKRNWAAAFEKRTTAQHVSEYINAIR
jgi:hypothetical protein